MYTHSFHDGADDIEESHAYRDVMNARRAVVRAAHDVLHGADTITLQKPLADLAEIESRHLGGDRAEAWSTANGVPLRLSTEHVRLAGDVVPLARSEGRWHVLVIERRWPPYQGCWALPGGHVEAGEEVEHAARRELAEETGISSPQMQRINAYTRPGRDPRGRYVSEAFLAVLDGMPEPIAGDDARAAQWVPVDELLGEPQRLAFDHHEILCDALRLVER